MRVGGWWLPLASRLNYSVLIEGRWLQLRATNEYDEDDKTMQRRVTDWVSGASGTLKLCHQRCGSDIYVRPSSIDAVTFP